MALMAPRVRVPSRTSVRAVWLGLVSGAADAAGWMKNGLFPAHMTGNTALIGVALVEHHPGLAATRVLVVLSFFAGLVLSPLLEARRRLGASAAVWGAAAFALAAALTPARPWDALLLATALAMQNAALHRFGGKSINTSFLTGNLQTLGATIARRLFGRGQHFASRPCGSVTMPCGKTRRGRARRVMAGGTIGAWPDVHLPG